MEEGQEAVRLNSMLRVIVSDAAEDRTKLKHQLHQLKVNMLDVTMQICFLYIFLSCSPAPVVLRLLTRLCENMFFLASSAQSQPGRSVA